MQRAMGHRLFGWLGLVAFVAANTCGSLWHEHSPVSQGAASHMAAHGQHAAHACQHDHADHCHSHSHAAAHSHASSASAAQHAPQSQQASKAHQGIALDQAEATHDDCVICRFIGQRVLTVSAVTLGDLSEASSQLAVRQPSPLSLDPARTLHSRAPPTLG